MLALMVDCTYSSVEHREYHSMLFTFNDQVKIRLNYHTDISFLMLGKTHRKGNLRSSNPHKINLTASCCLDKLQDLKKKIAKSLLGLNRWREIFCNLDWVGRAKPEPV